MFGLWEVNVDKEDPWGSHVIKGYDLISDKILDNSGRARFIILINSNIKYITRQDLMSPDTPEVWVEIVRQGKVAKIILFWPILPEIPQNERKNITVVLYHNRDNDLTIG